MPLNGTQEDHLLGVVHQGEPLQLPPLCQYTLQLTVTHTVPDVHNILENTIFSLLYVIPYKMYIIS